MDNLLAKNKSKLYLIRLFITMAMISISCNCNKTESGQNSPTRLIGDRDTKWETEDDLKYFFNQLNLTYTRELIFSDKCNELKHTARGDLTDYVSSLSADQIKEFEKNLTDKYKAPIYLKWVSDSVGYGVFAKETIPAKHFVITYTGKILSQDDKPEGTTWTWSYPPSGTIKGKKYSLASNDYGNEGRFFNDARSDAGNNLNVTLVYNENLKHYNVVYYTNRAVTKDSELCVSYGEGYWKNRD